MHPCCICFFGKVNLRFRWNSEIFTLPLKCPVCVYGHISVMTTQIQRQHSVATVVLTGTMKTNGKVAVKNMKIWKCYFQVQRVCRGRGRAEEDNVSSQICAWLNKVPKYKYKLLLLISMKVAKGVISLYFTIGLHCMHFLQWPKVFLQLKFPLKTDALK